MGLPASKFGHEIEQEEPIEGSLPSTPILTPKTRLIDLDPRSPSENIVRTPIEVLLAKHNGTTLIKSEYAMSSEKNGCDYNICSPAVKLKNIDPRSPTLDFQRTPIVIPEDGSVLPKKLHNKNLDNVRKTFETSPLARPFKKTPFNKITPPRLLESNVVSPKPIENKRKSYVGLLETNLDYIETDLDKVKPDFKIDENTESNYRNSPNLELGASAVSDPESDQEISEEYPTQNANMKTVCLNHPTGMNSLTNEHSVNVSENFEKLNIQDIPASEIVHVNDTSINHLEDNDDDVDNDGLCKSNIIVNEMKSDNKQENKHKEDNIKDFDKKLRNLIYEDKEKTKPIIRDKKANEYKSRVPLGTRNINTNLKRGISKLKVHDRPQKHNNDFSKIPVFQIKKNKSKISQQCENTPPRSIENKVKPEKLQWDPDNTIII